MNDIQYLLDARKEENPLEYCDVAIIGGGPAGLAAAAAARRAGAERVVVLERDARLGGILNQCIHPGFGLHRYNLELTGPEYAARDIAALDSSVDVKLNAMVLALAPDRGLTAVNPTDGLLRLAPGAVVLAMGCRERPRAPVGIHGDRPAGILTAGVAQRHVNLDGILPGRETVILGSGDIGLIMARRMTLQGARVKLVAEIMPHSAGLRRNILQCLDDFNIPLRLSTTVKAAHGRRRLEGVTLVRVDENLRHIPRTEEFVPCDTLLLAVGLIPENELARQAGVLLSPATGGAVVDECLQTSVPGIFACGNALQVHDVADHVSEEGATAGTNAARYSAGDRPAGGGADIVPGEGVGQAVPMRINPANLTSDPVVRFRVRREFRDAAVRVAADGSVVQEERRRIMAPGEMQSVRLRSPHWLAAAQTVIIGVSE